MPDESKFGLVAALVGGIGAIVILAIMMWLIISTLLSSSLLESNAITTNVTYEQNAYLNGSFYKLAQWNEDYTGYTLVRVWNASHNPVAAANYTFNTTSGRLQNTTAWTIANCNVSYTYVPWTAEESSAQSMSKNLTVGINKVSEKIPTILLIGAVVLLFGAIVLLVRQSREIELSGIGGNQGSL
jgi:hypothetical protein